MKKILVALVMLALVFGSAAAQEMSIAGVVDIRNDVLGTESTTWDKDAHSGAEAPDPTAKSFANPDYSWSSVTFSVEGDIAGATFSVEPTKLADGITLGDIEAWLRPFDFLKLTLGNTTWRQVERYQADISDFHIAYGINGVSKIDEFKEGLKVDIAAGPATITGLIGVNLPTGLKSGKFLDPVADAVALGDAIRNARKSISDTVVPSSATFNTNAPTTDAAVDAAETVLKTQIPSGGTYVSTSYAAVAGTATAATVVRVTVYYLPQGFAPLKDGGDDFGRISKYGLRVYLPLEGVGNFTVSYVLNTFPVDYIPNGVYRDGTELKGTDIADNTFGVFADLSPLFDGLGLPLKLVAGYTGNVVLGEKYLDGTDYKDAVPVLKNGIDLRVRYAINDALSIALHNNATLWTVKYDDASKGKISMFTAQAGVVEKGLKGMSNDYETAEKKDITYFRLFNALGAMYVINDSMKINLEFANDLATTGSYVKSDSTTGKDKGALAYWDKFDVRLDFYYYIGGDKNYLLRSGVMLSTTSYTEGDNKGDAYVNTVTKFSIPVRAVIKF